MDLQIGLGIAPRRAVAPVSGPVQAPMSAVLANGWTGIFPIPGTFDPDNAPVHLQLRRAGFDTAGAAISFDEAVVVTRRLREPYPNQAMLTPDTVTLSDYVYRTDIVPGVQNQSAATSPRPIANWVLPDRVVVGDSLTLEVVAFHRDARNGEQVACVEFSVTDGATTLVQKVSSTVVSPAASDRNAVIVHRTTFDLSGLANPATLTCNARIFPWVGDAASVADSAGVTVARGFSPRYYRRDTALHSAPPLAYVAAGGSDTAGVVARTATAAKAAPFATILGAIKGLKAASGETNGRIDGCEVRLGAGQWVAGSLAFSDVTGGIQDHAALTITRDPDQPRSACVMTFGSAVFRTRFPYLRLRDLSLLRTGLQTLQGEAGAQMQVIFDDISLDNAGNNATMLSNAHLYVNGCVATNAGSIPFAPGTYEIRLLRGLACASGTTVENWLLVGCRLTGGNHGTSLLGSGTRTSDGAICAYNYLSGYRPVYGTLAETMGCAIVQNVIEIFATASNTGLRLSADGATTNTSHVVAYHNTVAGYWNNGRSNFFYDETSNTPRGHSLMSTKANLHVSINNKGDIFIADGSRQGNWPYCFGVGCNAEFAQFDSGATTFRQEFPGLRAMLGTSTTTALSPRFVAPAHVTASGAGAGGGDYRILPDSPAKARILSPVLRFDLAGQPRSAAAASAGAHE